MNLAIIGSSGYIANYIINKFTRYMDVKYITKIDKSDSADLFLDLEAAESFDYESLNGMDYIIFTAAISGPDMCANEFDLCWRINVEGTGYFIKNALQQGCKVLFFSSDAVYGDISGAIYDEKSETCAKTPYGRMKKAIEDEFKADKSFKAIRLSYVASARDRFISYCLSCIEKNETAQIFHPFYRNVISVSDVVNVVDWLIHHWDEYEPFVLNVTGRELVSRVRMADELNRIYNNRLNYTIVSPGNEFYNNRPKVTQMNSLYLYEYGIIEDISFTEKIQRELK